MRYLKVTAHDLVGIGRANLVRLQFYQGSPSETDKLVDEAVAYDFTADGRVDYSRGDVTHDGKENLLDKRALDRFANTYLKLNWFNRERDLTRYMKIFSEDFYKDGTPDTVRLHVHEGEGTPCDKTQVMWNAAYDFDNDGALEWNIHFDINHDGVINDVDQGLVQELADTFLKFNWHAPSITTP